MTQCLDVSVILPGMRRKPAVVMIGAGNLASALGVSLNRAGYEIEAVIGHPGGAPRKTQLLAKKVGARALTELPREMRADVVWFCVPDGEIARTAKALARKAVWNKKVALHSSGALTSDELGPLRDRGAAVASAHPLMTFVPGSQPVMQGVPFALEGDAAAVRVARAILAHLGAQAHSIRKAEKAAYHAWGTFVSPLFTALLATAEQVAHAAGVPGKQVRTRAVPILLQTLANYASLGPAGAFSGPIVRGDLDTVRRHLQVLRRIPAARAVYIALGRAALEYLPANKRGDLTKTLRG
jgi:predicted short-subunit dehydrogenase-like oxidoreductase (DUF2520 family)